MAKSIGPTGKPPAKQSEKNTVGAKSRDREQMALVFVTIGVLVLFVAMIVIVLSQQATATQPQGGAYSQLIQDQTASGFPILGDPAAKVTLVEFSNFSCPGCAQYSSAVKEMVDKFVRTGQARLIYVPLIFNDVPSFIAAQGALCAGKQGGFWDMHDALFNIHRTQGARSFTEDIVRDAAASLKLDGNAVKQCILTGEKAKVVENAIELSSKTGVQFTPTLMYSLDGGQTLQWFEDASGARYGSSVPIADVERTIAQIYAN